MDKEEYIEYEMVCPRCGNDFGFSYSPSGLKYHKGKIIRCQRCFHKARIEDCVIPKISKFPNSRYNRSMKPKKLDNGKYRH